MDLVKKISKEVFDKKLNIDDIDENKIHESSCSPVNEIDLLIRTGGDKRISNFLLYQLSYAELIFIETLWPDVNEDILDDVLLEFKTRNRTWAPKKGYDPHRREHQTA